MDFIDNTLLPIKQDWDKRNKGKQILLTTIFDEEEDQKENKKQFKVIGINILFPSVYNLLLPAIYLIDDKHPLTIAAETKQIIANKPSTLRVQLEDEGSTYVFTGDTRTFKKHPHKYKDFTIIYANAISTEKKEKIEVESRPLALLEGNNLTMLWNVSESNAANSNILTFVVNKAISILEVKKFKLFESSSDKIRALMLEFDKRAIVEQEESLKRHKKDSGDYLRKYVEKEQEVTRLIAIINAANSVRDADKSTNELIELLEKSNKISSFDFRDGILTFNTQNMVLRWIEKGKQIPLPNYRVDININRGDMHIKTEVKTGLGGYCHPHVFEEGRACLGNYSTIFAKIVASRNYKQVVALTLEFLSSYNHSSPVRDWDRFLDLLTVAKLPHEITKIVTGRRTKKEEPKKEVTEALAF